MGKKCTQSGDIIYCNVGVRTKLLDAQDRAIKEHPPATKQDDEDSDTIRFTFSSDIVDRHGDIINQSGIDVKNYLKNPVFLRFHDNHAKPIGKTMSLDLIKRGKREFLMGDVVFARDITDDAEEFYQLYKGGYMNTVSVGLIVKDYDDETSTIVRSELLEVSGVNVPANPEASVSVTSDRNILTDEHNLCTLNNVSKQSTTKTVSVKDFKSITDTVTELAERLGKAEARIRKLRRASRADQDKLTPNDFKEIISESMKEIL